MTLIGASVMYGQGFKQEHQVAQIAARRIADGGQANSGTVGIVKRVTGAPVAPGSRDDPHSAGEHGLKCGVLARGAVAAGNAYEEVADPGYQSRRQTKHPDTIRRRLDRDVHHHEDQDPNPPGQFDIPQFPHAC